MFSDIELFLSLCADHAAYEGVENVKSSESEVAAALFAVNDSPINCMVAEQGGKLLGYVTFMKQFSTWDVDYYVYMDCLYLSAEFRGLGIGKKLLSEVINYARREGCKEIQWQTPESNELAINFYKKNGALPKSKLRFFKTLD